MLNISKYHRAIVGCSAIATASLAGLVQSANASEQFNPHNVNANQGTILIAQMTNVSNGSGSNVSNSTGTNVSNGSGSNVSNGSGSKYQSGPNGSRGFDAGTIGRAGTINTRYSNALANYDRAAAALAALEANQPNASDTSPVRYAREVADAAACGCPNADVVGSGSKPDKSKELAAAKAAEAEAATELAAAKAEARQFLESIKGSSTASGTSVSTPIW
jgi:hypothetical protein